MIWRFMVLMCLVGCAHHNKAAGEGADVYMGLREIPFQVHQAGVVIEMTSSDGKGGLTLVCMDDGSISLYNAAGGGMLGLGGRPELQPMAAAVRDGVLRLPALAVTEDRPLPKPGRIRLYALSANDTRVVDMSEEEIIAVAARLWADVLALLKAIVETGSP